MQLVAQLAALMPLTQPQADPTGRRRAACAAKKLSCASLTCSSSRRLVGSVAWHCEQGGGGTAFPDSAGLRGGSSSRLVGRVAWHCEQGA